MRLTTLKKTETTTAALIDRLYPNLTEAQRKKAETELLKANPHLADAAAFKPDTVVNLPEAPGLKPKAGQAGDDPVDEMLGQLKGAVGSYREDQAKRLGEALADVAGQEAILKDKEVVAAIKKSAEASKLAKELVVSLRERQKSLAVEKKAQEEVFAKIMEDLGALLK